MSGDSIQSELALPEQGVVYVCGEIDEELIAKVVLGIEGCVGTKLRVLISSEGGNVFDGMALADAIFSAKQRGVSVEAEVYGSCFSSANFPLMAADHRKMHKQAWLGIHGMASGMGGDMRTLGGEYAFNKRLVDQQVGLYVARSKFDAAYWEPLLQEQHVKYFNAEEALEAGLVDEIV